MKYEALSILVMSALLVVCLLTAPLHISASGHFSLGRRRLALDLSLFGLSVVRLRVFPTKGRLRATVNGKAPEGGKKIDVPAALRQLRGIRFEAEVGALIGGADAYTAAMIEATTAILAGICDAFEGRVRGAAYPTGDARTEVDGRISVKLSLAHVLAIAAAVLTANVKARKR